MAFGKIGYGDRGPAGNPEAEEFLSRGGRGTTQQSRADEQARENFAHACSFQGQAAL